MKKILFVLVALVFAAPAFADVDITIVQDADKCVAIISFDARSEPNLPRAFSLDIKADNDANIVEVIPHMKGVCTEAQQGYGIFPGTIQIDAEGTVTDDGTPVAPSDDPDALPGIDSNGVTIEMGSLYSPVGPASVNAPDPCGPLVSIRVDKECTLTITANVTRAGSSGVVMESPDEVVTVNLPAPLFMEGCNLVDTCIKETATERADWDSWGQPPCWCYQKQCSGDINGALFLGKPVTLADLNMFKAAFNLNNTDLAQVPDGICSDLNHAAFLGKRVTLADLNIFKLYFNAANADVPCCDDNQDCVIEATDSTYNFWTN
jgi:hypothetical protein